MKLEEWWSVVLVQRYLAHLMSVFSCQRKRSSSQRQKLHFIQFFIIYSEPDWSKRKHGSCERDLVSHKGWNMAWFGWKMAWFILHLVQLLKFSTSIALNCAKWQLLKQCFCCSTFLYCIWWITKKQKTMGVSCMYDGLSWSI
jgi:hypothetical protein